MPQEAKAGMVWTLERGGGFSWDFCHLTRVVPSLTPVPTDLRTLRYHRTVYKQLGRMRQGPAAARTAAGGCGNGVQTAYLMDGKEGTQGVGGGGRPRGAWQCTLGC